ncbi:Protoporphyrinogen oxidase,protoporphyrinogen oxidase,Protoporphyrinogen oxidase,protoporphyrinogen oxidase,Flavin containing amine oxidoreductase [Chlamydia serpentis]|uniref:Coproporphyrinogen III oxidase n=1 Tax=Chlamydia serpentis TaxID=1967782 RepID=A0A2R8FC76_9CHLA|nr:protoporphyrinogen oxidase [Chlamydia serpentis]SPN73998.1 Protoporphyrinogen oxidase,protoporphyrinogen oxidase,Protoporphyrinogen oxidase,protoporphyrinogen oxidase,Flavin containing amine oxidoreductase [Chlamydia serpentis]
MNKAIIVGSGISGLATAWWLQQKFSDMEILILDKAASPGGFVYTEHQKGFSFDLGPKGFLTKGEGRYTLKLIHELGLQDSLIFSDHAAKNRFVHYKGKTRKISFWTLMKGGLLPSLVKDFCASCYTKDSSIQEFLKRHSSINFTNYILDPLVTAIRAGRSHVLSTHMAFPELARREACSGSILRSYLKKRRPKETTKSEGYLASLSPSLGTLITTLMQKLSATWKFSTPATNINCSSEKAYVTTPSGIFSGDLVIYTGPMHQLPILFPNHGTEDLAKSVLPWNLSSISLGWHKPKFSLPKGYGMLFADEPPLLGIVWNSQIFPQCTPGMAALSILVEGKWHERQAHAFAITALSKYLGINQYADAFALFSPQDGMPQHAVGFPEARQRVIPSLPRNLKIVGQNIAGPGLNRSIASAYHTVYDLSR